MRDFERKLLTEWRRLGLPAEGAVIVVAVSGGADSLGLAHALLELKDAGKLADRFVLAHFNHNLRGEESLADEVHVRRYAESRGAEFAVGHAGHYPKGNLEQAARDARYEFLERVAAGVGSTVVLTAHTVDDQAETFLMNLLRGAGPKGLSGMPAIREIGNGADFDVLPDWAMCDGADAVKIVRPLLYWARRIDTEGYCREAGLGFRYDSMNEDQTFTRVRLRKVLIPMLEEFNPRVVETLARTAEILRTAGQEAHPDEPDWETDETLRISEISGVPRGRLELGLRMWIGARRGSVRGLTQRHVEAVADLVMSGKSGKTAELPGKSAVIKSRGLLMFRK